MSADGHDRKVVLSTWQTWPCTLWDKWILPLSNSSYRITKSSSLMKSKFVTCLCSQHTPKNLFDLLSYLDRFSIANSSNIKIPCSKFHDALIILRMPSNVEAIFFETSWWVRNEGDDRIWETVVWLWMVETEGVPKTQWAMSATRAPPRHRNSNACRSSSLSNPFGWYVPSPAFLISWALCGYLHHSWTQHVGHGQSGRCAALTRQVTFACGPQWPLLF